MAGIYIDIPVKDGGKFRGYFVVPPAGKGPGIVLAQEIFGINQYLRDVADYYAEEGYVVLVPDLFWRQQPNVDLGYSSEDWQRAFGLYQGFDQDRGVLDIAAAIDVLRSRSEVAGGIGCLGFCLGGKLAYLVTCRCNVDVAVGYYGVGIENNLGEAKNIERRLVLHFAEQDQFCPAEARKHILAELAGKDNVELYVYPGADHAFSRPASEHYDKPAALMAHQRSMAAFRKELGPQYDLSALWDRHCEYEFASRDVDATMSTMVPEPYVNHVPTMTGGVGYTHLHRFYTHHFVNSNPLDTRLVPISRTVGATQILDEMLFCFTHTCEIDWMLPGVAPTGKYVEIPLVSIIKFRGTKLYHEHIYWDQASVLVQIGKLSAAELPVAGIETARKLLDEKLPSNTLMKRWAESGSR